MEFEGKTEKEAIDKAVEALGLERDEFDVEILENNKPGLFHKGNVKRKGKSKQKMLLQRALWRWRPPSALSRKGILRSSSLTLWRISLRRWITQEAPMYATGTRTRYGS